MGWLANPKRAAYNHIYHKTTVGIDKMLKNNSTHKIEKEIVNKSDMADLMINAINENLTSVTTADYRGLKKYIKEKDYELTSTIYDKIFEKLKINEEYGNAIDVLICAMYLRIYAMLPSDGMLFDVDYYERHLSRLRKYIKRIPKNIRNEVWNTENIDNLVRKGLNKYLTPLNNKEKTDKFIECLKKYL